jgi:hypothetical protein
MAGHRMNHHGSRNGTCGEPGAGTTGTPGSGGDSGKPTGRNTGRAPRVDLTLTFWSVGPGRACPTVHDNPLTARAVPTGSPPTGPFSATLLSRLLSVQHAFQPGFPVVRACSRPARKTGSLRRVGERRRTKATETKTETRPPPWAGFSQLTCRPTQQRLADDQLGRRVRGVL